MTTENEVRSRVQFVLTTKKLSMNSLASGDSNLARKIYKQLSEKKTLTFSTIEALLNAVPELSTEWLFRGTGEPFEIPAPAQEEHAEHQVIDDVVIPARVFSMLLDKDEQIKQKDACISQLTNRLLTMS